MKKIGQRDQLLLLFLLIFGLLAVFYKYVYEPFDVRATELKEKKDALKSESESKKIDEINSKVNNLQNQLKIEEAEKKEFEKQRMITKEQQEKLLRYIGEKANSLNINLNKFEEKETTASSYNVVGYDIKARGESKELVLFLNSLYAFYNYCFITDVNLRKVEVTPTFETDELDTLTEEAKEKISWNDEQINLILFDIPPIVTEDDEQQEGDANNKKTPTKKELQLDFSLYFILSD